MESPTKPIRVIAHRGNQILAPENTMIAFRQALDLGVDAIETDVRVSLDGVAFLLHDADLSRTTDQTGDAAALMMDALGAVNAGAKKGVEYHGEPVPTLADLAKLCRGRARLVLDLKVNGTAEAIVAALLEADYPHDHVSVCAWNDVQAHEVLTTLPDTRLIYIDEDPHDETDEIVADGWYDDLIADGYRGVSLEWHHLSDTAIRAARSHELAIVTWTVNSREDMATAIDSGVDGIITDDPKTLISMLRDRGLR